jgi:D-alanyl-D-alanine carboxypeptidase
VRGRGVTIYATLLGSPSRSVRNGDLKELLAWGVAQYRVVAPIRTDRVYARARLPYGKGTLALHADRPFQAVARVEQPLRQKVIAAKGVKLPVREGDVLGRVEVWSGRRLMARRDLVASRTVNRPSLPGRLRWYAGRTARNLWGMFT